MMVELGTDTPGNNPNDGTPLNPYNHRYYCGGSSTGSAYAVSAGLVPFAAGADAGGWASASHLGSFCGIFGLNPSHDRVSRRPSANGASSNGVTGPLAACMIDLELGLRLMATPDPRDQNSSLLPYTAPNRCQDPNFLESPSRGSTGSMTRSVIAVVPQARIRNHRNQHPLPSRGPELGTRGSADSSCWLWRCGGLTGSAIPPRGRWTSVMPSVGMLTPLVQRIEGNGTVEPPGYVAPLASIYATPPPSPHLPSTLDPLADPVRAVEGAALVYLNPGAASYHHLSPHHTQDDIFVYRSRIWRSAIMSKPGR
ncbi:amidase signature domain-containing protein [Nemania sp. FL0031]|nr:amidase signature domain-containing protein [Nemania sp. FL0031]